MGVSWAEHFHLLLSDLNPRVFKYLLRGDAAIRVLVEELLKEEASLWRDMLGELDLLLADVSVELLVILSSEGELATEKGKE